MTFKWERNGKEEGRAASPLNYGLELAHAHLEGERESDWIPEDYSTSLCCCIQGMWSAILLNF